MNYVNVITLQRLTVETKEETFRLINIIRAHWGFKKKQIAIEYDLNVSPCI